MGRAGQRDLTTGPIGSTLLAFALPTLGSNVLQSLNGSINTIWVGRFLGEGALAATSNANMIMFLMFSAVFGFGMAATILVGQSFGRRDIEGARRAFGIGGRPRRWAALSSSRRWGGSSRLPSCTCSRRRRRHAARARSIFASSFSACPRSMLLVLLTMGLRGTGDSLTPLVVHGH